MSAHNWFAASLRNWFGTRTRTEARHSLTARPQCEALEERVVPASLSHLYNLNGSLTDQFGGPSLVSDGGTLSGTRYSFTTNHGLQLNNALANVGDYSIVMKLQVLSSNSTFKKLIDFSTRTSDNGLYATGTHLQFYPGAGGSDNIAFGSDFQLALTRNGATGEVRLYLNGLLQQSYTSSNVTNAAVIAGNALRFFEDDAASGFGEFGTGSADYIALYDGALSGSEVANLATSLAVTFDNAVTVTEGQRATNTGKWTGAAFETTTLSASVGTVTQNANGTWSWFFDTVDDRNAPQSVSITATDSAGGTQVSNFTLTVMNDPPQFATLTSSNPSTALASTTGLVTVAGAFSDAGILDTHTVTVNWGDGGASEQLTSVDEIARTFSGDHQYTHSGTYLVSVAVADHDGGATTQSVMAVVVNPAPEIVTFTSSNSTPSAPSIDGQVSISGFFSDAGLPDTQVLTVLWGDGSAAETLTTVDPHTHGFSGQHRYSHGGHYSITLTVVDSEGGQASQDVAAEVVNPAPQFDVLTSSHATSGNASTNGQNDIAGSFDDPGFVEAHTVTVNWGDGTAVQTLTPNPTTNAFTASHQYASAGVYTISVTVTDQEGGTATQTLTAVVVNPAPQLVSLTSSNPNAANASTNGDVTVQGSFTDPGFVESHTVRVNWGDGSAVETLTNVNPTTNAFSGGHHYAQSGAYTVTVTVLDANGSSVSQTVSAVVAYPAPPTNGSLQINGLTSSNPTADKASSNGKVTIEGSFLDSASNAAHAVTVCWGDGSAAETLKTVNQVKQTFFSNHRYEDGGVYTITVTVTAKDGRSTTQTVSAFVTGVGLVDGTLYVVGGAGKDSVFIEQFKRGKHTGWGKAGEAVYRVLTKFASGGAGASRFGVNVDFFNVADVKKIVLLTGPGDVVRTPQSQALKGGRPELNNLFDAFRWLWESDGPSQRPLWSRRP